MNRAWQHMIKAIFTSIRRRVCSHQCSINDLESSGPPTDPKRVVWAPCRKCGRILKASFGLDLPCTWTQEPKLS
jgi:hypothetical protein